MKLSDIEEMSNAEIQRALEIAGGMSLGEYKVICSVIPDSILMNELNFRLLDRRNAIEGAAGFLMGGSDGNE